MCPHCNELPALFLWPLKACGGPFLEAHYDLSYIYIDFFLVKTTQNDRHIKNVAYYIFTS